MAQKNATGRIHCITGRATPERGARKVVTMTSSLDLVVGAIIALARDAVN
jgi:hypothetical protein